MINNTIYTNNSSLGTVYSNGISSLIMQTLQNQVNKMNSRLSTKNSSYAEVLKQMQNNINNSEESAQKKTTTEMTMDEYKEYIATEIKKFSFDTSRFDDDEIIQISNAGWQAMKSDTDYESWVLSKIKSSRLSKNQLATMGFGGSHYILSFGAKKSEFNEQTWVKNFNKIDDFFSGVYNSSSLFGSNNSKNKSSGFGSIFSMQAERLKLQTQLAKNYMNMNQQLQSSLESAFQNVKYYF